MGPRALPSSERKSRNSVYDSFDATDAPQRGWLQRNLPLAVAGALLVLSFAFAGSLIGLNASATNKPESMAAMMVAPTSELEGKGSLFPATTSVTSINVLALRRQTVMSEDKSDLANVTPPAVARIVPPLPKAKPANIATIAASQKAIKITPASYSSDEEEDTPAPAAKRMIATPAIPSGPVVLVPPVTQPQPIPQPKSNAVVIAPKTGAVAIAPKASSPVLVQQRIKTAELTCLARAVYFESRSESEMGQLAVAKVVLNRLKDPNFPKTICGVVYQGSERRNSCQFSFACDGLPDVVRSAEAWARSKRIAERALADDPAIRMLHAVNYHADYVNPRWSKTMKRLVRIGHHIFYSHRKNG